uniref:F-box/LRR-repeat protein 2-like n=1 Tax=Fragaria vesca subsp. vesca TaxID=101020 RepID=UPI0005C903AF|nr:PREDICTED: F-box/LRR-repeat protein 2-like [Fragaria vesca subsp. vesca]
MLLETGQLTDDLLGQILKRVAEVCKLWFTLEGLTRRSLTLLRLSFLRQQCFFRPTVCQVAAAFRNCSRFRSVGEGLVVDNDAVEAIGRLCTRLSYLNLKYAEISDNGLRLLAQGRCSKTLNTLVLAQCYDITDSGFCHLQNLQCLEELDLESCGYRTGVTDSGVIAAVSGNRSRKKLNLGRLTNVSDQSIVFVAGNCPNLEILDLSGSYVTGAGVRAFSGHRCLQSLDLRMCSEFRLSDIEHMVLGCQSLKSIVLSNMIKETIPESLSRIVKFADELWL